MSTNGGKSKNTAKVSNQANPVGSPNPNPGTVTGNMKKTQSSLLSTLPNPFSNRDRYSITAAHRRDLQINTKLFNAHSQPNSFMSPQNLYARGTPNADKNLTDRQYLTGTKEERDPADRSHGRQLSDQLVNPGRESGRETPNIAAQSLIRDSGHVLYEKNAFFSTGVRSPTSGHHLLARSREMTPPRLHQHSMLDAHYQSHEAPSRNSVSRSPQRSRTRSPNRSLRITRATKFPTNPENSALNNIEECLERIVLMGMENERLVAKVSKIGSDLMSKESEL